MQILTRPRGPVTADTFHRPGGRHPARPALARGAVVLIALAAITGCGDSNTPSVPTGLSVTASLDRREPTPQPATVETFATGLTNPRGLRFGPDGALYVSEGGTGGTISTVGQCPQVPAPVGPYMGGSTAQVTRIGRDGQKSVVVTGLPSTVDAMGDVSGVSDLEFLGDALYLLIGGAGCSHGHTDMPNAILRVNPNGSWTRVANLSEFYQTHPTAHMNPDDFEPDGTPYSMVGVGRDLFVVEPNHGSLDRVQRDGKVRRVLDVSASYGHIVPTSVTFHGAFFIGNLNTFPVVPGSSRIIETMGEGWQRTVFTGLTAVVGSAWDHQGRYYVLESMTAPGNPTPMTGRVLRIDPLGKMVTIADGLSFPTAMTLGPDGNLYVSNLGFGAPPTGVGSIVRIRIN